MSLSPRNVKLPPVKRVSFQDSVHNTFKEANKNGSNVEISELFPHVEMKSILHHSTSLRAKTMSPMSKEAKTFLNKRRRRKIYSDTKQKIRRNQFLPPKEPTETPVHAMLRSMTYKEPSKKSKLFIPTIALVTEADRASESSRSRSTTRSFHSLQHFHSRESLAARRPAVHSSLDFKLPLPEIITTKWRENSVDKYDRECGPCRNNWRQLRKPAAGFCEFCNEFLCPDCIHNHRSRLTRLHPIIVFICDTCQEMNILNNKGSGYCVRCRHFYCCVCIVLHCSMTGHEVLEGRDMFDVTDVMIGK